MGDRRWSNWAGNQRCAPVAIERPRTEADLVAIVERAAAAGRRVKVVGAGHSFTDIACTDGHLVDLADYGRLLRFDAVSCQATMQAGMRLSALNRVLAQRGAALENLGDIAYQSVAGATSTATHGTGLRFGNLATRIVALRLVTGNGTVLACSAEEHPEVFRVARVGLGALGVVSEMTIQCVPAFNLHAVEAPRRVDDVLESWEETARGSRPFRVLLGTEHRVGPHEEQPAHHGEGPASVALASGGGTRCCTTTSPSGPPTGWPAADRR